jgi:hypothetical protein
MGKPAKPRMTRADLRQDRATAHNYCDCAPVAFGRWVAALDEIAACWRDLRTERRRFAAEFRSHLRCDGEADAAIDRLKAERNQARRRAAVARWLCDCLTDDLRVTEEYVYRLATARGDDL